MAATPKVQKKTAFVVKHDKPGLYDRHQSHSMLAGSYLATGIVLLVPGYGAQGGTALDVAPAFDADGLGALINNSRGLTFAYGRPAFRARFAGDWQGAIAQAVREMVEDLAAHTHDGRLRPGSPS